MHKTAVNEDFDCNTHTKKYFCPLLSSPTNCPLNLSSHYKYWQVWREQEILSLARCRAHHTLQRFPRTRSQLHTNLHVRSHPTPALVYSPCCFSCTALCHICCNLEVITKLLATVIIWWLHGNYRLVPLDRKAVTVQQFKDCYHCSVFFSLG